MEIFKHIVRYINSTTNPHVPITQLQQLSIHGESYFIQTSYSPALLFVLNKFLRLYNFIHSLIYIFKESYLNT